MRSSIVVVLVTLCSAPAFVYGAPAPRRDLAGREDIDIRDVIDAEANVNVDVDHGANGDHDRHYQQGLLDYFSLDRVLPYIFHLLSLYGDYEFEDNYDLLGFLVNNADITGEEADRLGRIDILGLFRGSRSDGLLSKLEGKLTESSDDTVSAAVTLPQGGKENAIVDADVDANVDANVDADVDADVEV